MNQPPCPGAPKDAAGRPHFLYIGGMRMKKLIALLLAFICLFGIAIGESPATPTDLDESLIEIDDDDWGEIEIEFERQVYIDIGYHILTIGDEITLTAILVNFKPNDIMTFQWEYSIEQNADWVLIDDETKQTYTFILDETNRNYWYRVIVEWEEIV